MFSIDERIGSTSFILGEWPLSQVLLKNEAQYPWLILVPKKNDICELFQLEESERLILMEEINQLSLLMNGYFNPDKLNIATLGNVVPQLHIHVVGRFRNDPLWPQGIWHSGLSARAYTEEQLSILLPDLTARVREKTTLIGDVQGAL